MTRVRIRGTHLLRQINGVVWAIQPEKLEAIADFLALRANGGEVSADEIRAITGARTERVMQRSGGVAVLPLVGTMLHRATSLQESSGLMSIERFGQAFDAAVRNPDIETIVIHVDSPGGTVAGTPELAQKIYDARGQKKIIAVADALMASAAYYVASAADEIIATPSAEVGSVGVFHMHFDFSRMLDTDGVTPTITKFGRFKAETNQLEPLSEDAKAHLAETVATFGRMFLRDVARNRGMKQDGLHERFGEGRVFTAEKAKAAGMIDRVASFEQVMEELGVTRDRLAGARAQEEQDKIAALEADGPSMIAFGSSLSEASSSWVELSADPAPEGESEDVPENEEDVDDVPEASGGASGGDHSTTATNAARPAEEGETMSKDTVAPGGAATVTVSEDATALERKRIQDINRLCAEHGAPPALHAALIDQGTSATDAEKFLVATSQRQNGTITPPAPRQLVDMGADERNYSVLRAINAAASGNWQGAGLEREVQAEIERKLNIKARSDRSVIIPTALGRLPRHFRGVDDELARPRAALDTATATGGEELVFTEPGSFIDMLRNRMVTTAMGATFLPGLQGNVSFPKQTGAGTFSWRAENPGTDVSISDLVTGQVELSPRDGTSATAFSRRLLAQSVVNVEQLVRRDLSTIAALGIDLSALHGASGGDSPVGLYAASGVNSVAFGGPVSWAKIVEMETKIVENNADISTLGYVTTPGVRGDAKTTEKAQGTAQFLWTGSVQSGEMNGYRAMASNQVSKTLGAGAEHGILFGAWEHLLIGEWGALELIVDPFTLARQGLIVVTVYVIADVAIRYAEAFSKGTGLELAAAAS